MIIAPQFTLIGQEFFHGDLMTTPRKEEMKRKQEEEIIHYRDQSQKRAEPIRLILKLMMKIEKIYQVRLKKMRKILHIMHGGIATDHTLPEIS